MQAFLKRHRAPGRNSLCGLPFHKIVTIVTFGTPSLEKGD
jgi:hypothetical protein